MEMHVDPRCVLPLPDSSLLTLHGLWYTVSAYITYDMIPPNQDGTVSVAGKEWSVPVPVNELSKPVVCNDSCVLR